MRFSSALFAFLVVVLSARAQSPSMLDNMNYRLSWGDLGPVTPAPIEKLRALRIASGSNALLNECLASPEKWHKDSLIYRFGHGHPLTTIGCRERAAPSLHVVFYLQPDGSRQAWIHFDRYRPGNFFGHAAEVIQNRLTFGRTSQADIYRALVVSRDDPTQPIPAPRYDFQQHAKNYWRSTFSPSSLLPSVLSGGGNSLIDDTLHFGDGGERYVNHIEANLVRHVTQQSLEFGFAAMLRQDEAFATSKEKRLSKRIEGALYHSFFVPGRNGDEFAFPRVAAAFGTGWMTHEWHPWRSDNIDPWRQASLILSSYIARSFWQEFEAGHQGWAPQRHVTCKAVS